MKKMICLLLVASLMLSACNNVPDEKNAEAGNNDAEKNLVLAENSWETDTSPMTITWFVAYDWYSKTWNPGNNSSDTKILTDTGITLEITSGDTDKLNALISAGKLPDLITMDVTATQRTLLENGGELVALESLFEEYAPDVNIPQSMKDWYRNEDGKWYSIASYYYGPERVNSDFGGYLVTHNNNFVRQDLLKEIGMTLEDLRTKEGLLNALRASSELSYDGMKVIPYTGWWTKNIAEQFGMDREDKEGNLLTTIRQPEWLEALKFANTLYREGLITDEEFTQNQSQRDQKIASGQVFLMTGTSVVQSPKEALYSYDPEALIVYAGQVQGGNKGKLPLLEGVSSGGWTATMITSNAENPGRIAQFISYMTQEEQTLNAGPSIGANTYDIVEGKMVRKDSVIEAFETDYASASAKYLMNIEFFVDWTIIQKYTGEEPQTIWEEQVLQIEKDDRTHIYDSKTFDAVAPIGGSDLAATKAAIDSYYDTAEKTIIMADSEDECELLYNETIKIMEKMGWNDVETYENKKFQEAKTKLGIDFAWPRNSYELN